MSAVTPVTSVTPAVTVKRNVTKKKPKPSAFQKLRLKVSLSIPDCAELCGVTVRTVRNWDAEGAPLIAMRFLHLYDRQDLAGHGPGWQGFKFSRGKLVCGRLSFTPRNLKQIPHYVDVYNRVQGARLRHDLDGLQPEQALAIVLESKAFDLLPLLE